MSQNQPDNAFDRPADDRVLTDGDVEAIAEATATRLAEIVSSAPGTFALVDARQLAGDLGVSLDYVYAHATELGAMRLGSGPKARIRLISIARGRRSRPGQGGQTAAEIPRPLVPLAARHRPTRRSQPNDPSCSIGRETVGPLCDDEGTRRSGRDRSAGPATTRKSSMQRETRKEGLLMPRPTLGHVFERPWADGRRQLRRAGTGLWPLREGHFRHQQAGLESTRAELETERIVQQIERGTWVPPRLEPREDPLEERSRRSACRSTRAFVCSPNVVAVKAARSRRGDVQRLPMAARVPGAVLRSLPPWATFAAMIGRDPKWIASQIGHVSPSFTFSVYQQVANSSLHRRAGRMDVDAVRRRAHGAHSQPSDHAPRAPGSARLVER